MYAFFTFELKYRSKFIKSFDLLVIQQILYTRTIISNQ